MHKKPESDAEYVQRMLAYKQKIEADRKAGKYAVNRRQPNLPAIILIMTAVFALQGWETYQRHKTLNGFWQDFLGLQHWRYPWLAPVLLVIAVAAFAYRFTDSYRTKPVKLWPAFLAGGGVLLVLGIQEYPRQFAWSDLLASSWWRQHWHGLTFTAFMVILYGYIVAESLVRAYRAKQKLKAQADWYRSLDAIVDLNDFKDRDDLYPNLDAQERLRLMQELQRLPKGSRSLRQAALNVCPELVADSGTDKAVRG